MTDYRLTRVKPHVSAAANEIGTKFGYTVIGGWRAVGSVPNSDHPKGRALDFMTLSKAKGDATVEYAIANAGRLGITYIIYWKRIWTVEGGWKEYDGPNPHIDHVHISFTEDGGDGSNRSGEDSENGGLLDPASWPVIGEINDLAEKLQDPERWQRVGLYALGAFLIVMGMLFLFRRTAGNMAKEIVG